MARAVLLYLHFLTRAQCERLSKGEIFKKQIRLDDLQSLGLTHWAVVGWFSLQSPTELVAFCRQAAFGLLHS